jgi:hypothetical protein
LLQQRLSVGPASWGLNFRDGLAGLRAALRNEDRIHLWTLVALIAAGVAIRLVYLFQPMRYDEAFTFISYASKPLKEGLADYTFPNNHLFHTFLVHLVYRVFGNQPWVIRLPALCAGCLQVVASYALMRRLYNRHAGLLCAAVIASSAVLIEYSTNARGYSLAGFFFLVLLLVAIHLVRTNCFGGWLVFVAVSSLGLYTMPVMVYPFGIAVTWLLLTVIMERQSGLLWPRIRSLFLSCLAIVVLTVLLYAPVLISFGLKSIVANRFVVPKPWPRFVTALPRSLATTWEQWNLGVPRAVTLLLAAGLVAATVLHRSAARQRVPVLAAAVVWLVPVLLVKRVVPFPRVWSFLFPLYAGVACAGVVVVLQALVPRLRRSGSVGFAGTAVVLFLWLALGTVRSGAALALNERHGLRDVARITLDLRDALQPDDKVIAVCPSDAPMMYYFGLYNVPLQHLCIELENSRRTWAVVNEPVQTLEDLISEEHPLRSEYSRPACWRRYDSATVYLLENTNAVPPTTGDTAEGRTP